MIQEKTTREKNYKFQSMEKETILFIYQDNTKRIMWRVVIVFVLKCHGICLSPLKTLIYSDI